MGFAQNLAEDVVLCERGALRGCDAHRTRCRPLRNHRNPRNAALADGLGSQSTVFVTAIILFAT